MTMYDLVRLVRFPRPGRVAGAGEPAGSVYLSLLCPRCGDPYTSGCTTQVCAVLSSDVDDATAERLAKWLYDYRYGAGRWTARFGIGPERGEALHRQLVAEARDLLGTFVLGELGWAPPDVEPTS